MLLMNFIRQTHLRIQQGLHESRQSAFRHRFNRPLEMTRLEERVLFSATVIGPVLAEMADAGEMGSPDSAYATLQSDDVEAGAAEVQLDVIANCLLPVRDAAQSIPSSDRADERSLELVFLDPSISNLDQMMSSLRSDSAADESRTLEFIVLDSQKDGIAQITSALVRHNGVDGLHILSHGEAGRIHLGSTLLSMDTLDAYRSTISGWQYSMSEKADVLFYGCNLAASSAGQKLVFEISQLTAADVAASEDLTGHASLDGDWDLEYQAGEIQSAVVAGTHVQDKWTGLLAPPAAADDSYSMNEDTTLVVGPLSTNLVNWWQFNDGGTNQTAVDSGSLGNNGTLGNASDADAADPAWTTGYSGSNALSFDGSDDYVATNSTAAKTASAFTLSAWFQTDTTTGQHHILWQGYSDGNGYGSPPGTSSQSEMNLTIGDRFQDNKIVFFLGYDVTENGFDPIEIVSASNFTDTASWHHVAVTVSDLGGGIFSGSLYVDGVLEGTDTGIQNDRSEWGSLLIGRPGLSSRYFDGQIDEVRVYETALSAAAVEDIAKSGVLQNDSDADSTIFRVNTSVVTGPANGTLSLNSDGSFRYTPNADFSGVDTFTYTATDGAADSNVATVTITVIDVNDAPEAVSDTATAVEAGGIANGTAGTSPAGNVLTNDIDVDFGDARTVSGVAAGTVGSASGSVGSGVTGSYGSITIAADGSYTYTVDNNSAAVEALRTAGSTLIDVFTYTMQDAAGSTSTTQVTVTIHGADDTPHDMSTAGLVIAENAANGSNVGIITSSDVDDADTPAYSLFDSAGGRFSIDASTGVVTVANGSQLDFETTSTHTLTIRVIDLAGSYYDEVFIVSLTDVDEGGVSGIIDTNPAPDEIPENSVDGTPVGIIGLAVDPDSAEVVTYSLDDSAGGRFRIDAFTGEVSVADGSLLNREVALSHNITVRAMSTDGSSSTQMFTISVLDLNDTPPVIAAGQLFMLSELAPAGSDVGDALAMDADSIGTLLNWVIAGGNTDGIFAIAQDTGQITVADPTRLDFETVSSHTLSLTVSDGVNTSAPQTFEIRIVDQNEVPVFAPDSLLTVEENSAVGTIVGNVSADDQDADDTIAYSLTSSANGWFLIDSATGNVTIAAGASLDFESADSFEIRARATDIAGLMVEKSFVIFVTDLNEAPVGVTDLYITLQFGSMFVTTDGVLLNDIDPDSDILSAVLVTGPIHGVLNLHADGLLNYTPGGSFAGIDFFTYIASDGSLSSNIVTVTVDVRVTMTSAGTGTGDDGSPNDDSNEGGADAPGDGSSDGGNSDSDSEIDDNELDVPSYVVPGAGNRSAGEGRSSRFHPESQASTSEVAATRSFETQQVVFAAGFEDAANLSGAAREQKPAAEAVEPLNRRHSAFSRFTMASIDGVVREGFFRIGQGTDIRERDESHSAFALGDKVIVGTTAVVSTSLSVGYVIWILRGGSLLTAFMSALPAWHAFDPLPVLQSFERRDEKDDESLLTLVTRQAANAVKRAVNR